MSIIDKLPLEFSSLISEIFRRNFELFLVGGGARSFAKYSCFDGVKDFDFEIRHLTVNETEWEIFLNTQFKEIASLFNEFKFKVMSYNVYSFTLNDISVEFASPRVEVFSDDLSHKNFEAKFLPRLDLKKAFKRRDLTINAFAYRFVGKSQGELLDPLGGLNDFFSKRLVCCCNENFSRDYVRLLRLIRFSINLQFSISISSSILKTFNLEKMTSYFFLKEWRKAVSPIEFIKILFDIVEKNNIACNPIFDDLYPILELESSLNSIDSIIDRLILSDNFSNNLREFLGVRKSRVNSVKKSLPYSSL